MNIGLTGPLLKLLLSVLPLLFARLVFQGIIQTIRELSDNNGGVAVTVARYETPKHNDINKAGIPVDVATNVECAKDDALACLPSNVL